MAETIQQIYEALSREAIRHAPLTRPWWKNVTLTRDSFKGWGTKPESRAAGGEQGAAKP
jgi:hypothetical protein